MTAIPSHKKIYTPGEYLELERKATHKSEFYKGEIFAMSGASLIHNKITSRFFSLLSKELDIKTYSIYGSDLRVHIPANSLFTYPDISVVSGKEELLDQEFDTLLNPVFIAEILSPSTANYDTGTKFTLYRSIPSLKEYWTISSFEYRVQKFVKNEKDNTWILSETTNINDVMVLSTFDISVSLKTLYDGTLEVGTQ